MVDWPEMENKMPKIGPPSFPYRGPRGVDSYGAGGFGAPRDGGKRRHPGLDFLALPGDAGIASITGIVRRVGIAKSGTILGSIHIEGTDEFKGSYVKQFYTASSVRPGQRVKMGDQIGIVQDVASWYKEHFPKEGEMKNHVHLELRMTVDPQWHLVSDLPAVPA